MESSTATNNSTATNLMKRGKKNPSSMKWYEMIIVVLALTACTYQFITTFAANKPFPEVSWWTLGWGVLVGSQMLVTKAMRFPLAPGKWIDYSYVPIWVLAFTLPAYYSLLLLILFSAIIYIVFPNQFSCRKTVGAYVFHLSYQILLFFVTIQCFWLARDYFSEVVWGGLSLTGTMAMFASMFGLMFTDTFLGGLIQKLEGQRHVGAEWLRDYGRITLVQTLLSSLAMLFAVLYGGAHYIQLAVIYGFFLLAIGIMHRATFRQEDYMGMLRSMMNMVELKDTYTKNHSESVANIKKEVDNYETDYTKNHSESVAFYSVIMGQKLGFPSSRLERLNIAAQLHDIGKVGIPDEILKKQGPLSSAEYGVMKTHVKLGEKVIAPIHSLHKEAFIIGHHHEHVDGTGYPYQVMMKDIPLEARIISIADAYHAMISKRPYTLGIGTDEAIHRLKLSKGTQFDPTLVDLFCEYLRAPAKHTHRFRPFCLVH